MHATKNVCVKGSRARVLLASAEAQFLKYHHSYDKIDAIIAPSEFMKSKLDEGGYAGRTIAMQNFLTDSQMAMGARVANTHKFDDAQAGERPYVLFFGRLSQEKGILDPGEGIPTGRWIGTIRGFGCRCRPRGVPARYLGFAYRRRWPGT